MKAGRALVSERAKTALGRKAFPDLMKAARVWGLAVALIMLQPMTFSAGGISWAEAAKPTEQQTITAIIGGETFVFPVEWIRTRYLQLELPDKRLIGADNIDQFLQFGSAIPVYAANIYTNDFEKPRFLPGLSFSLPGSFDIRGDSQPPIKEKILIKEHEIRKKAQDYRDAKGGRVVDAFGFWSYQRDWWILSNPKRSRPMDEPLVIWCTRLNLSETCNTNFSWSATVSIGYSFHVRSFPRSEWERLDSHVLDLLKFLHRDVPPPSLSK
jgi:hypothetical protein